MTMRRNVIKEIQQSNYSHQTESTLKTYEKQLKTLSKNQSAEEMKFYNFQIIRNILKNIHTEFEKMQNLAQQEELLKLLFSKFFVGQRPQITEEDHLRLLGMTPKAEVKEHAKDLKALLQKFFPYLFEKIYVKKDKSILKISFTPTGLFLLLTEKPVRHKDNQGLHFDPHSDRGRNWEGTLPAHHY